MPPLREMLIDQATLNQALTLGILTQEQCNEFNLMANDPFFWPNPDKPFANGIISLEEYRKIPGADDIKARRLFSPDAQKMLQEGKITLEEYSQLPIAERDKKMVNVIKENTMENKSKATLLNQDSSLTQCHTAMFSHLTTQASQPSTPPSSPILRK